MAGDKLPLTGCTRRDRSCRGYVGESEGVGAGRLAGGGHRQGVCSRRQRVHRVRRAEKSIRGAERGGVDSRPPRAAQGPLQIAVVGQGVEIKLGIGRQIERIAVLLAGFRPGGIDDASQCQPWVVSVIGATLKE